MDDRTTPKSARSSTPYDGAHEAPLRLSVGPGRAPARFTFIGALSLAWVAALFQAPDPSVRIGFTALLLCVGAAVPVLLRIPAVAPLLRGEAGGVLVLQPDGRVEVRQLGRDAVQGTVGTRSWVGHWFCVVVMLEPAGRRSRRFIAWRTDQRPEHYRRLRCWLLHRFVEQDSDPPRPLVDRARMFWPSGGA